LQDTGWAGTHVVVGIISLISLSCVLLGLFILSTLFGSLDVYCWDFHSSCLSPQIHKKNTLVRALALPETLAVIQPIALVNF
jgi:hypothetical protein